MPDIKQTYKNHGLDEATLRNLYLEQVLSDKEIGNRYGITDVAVSYFRKKFGISTIGHKERHAVKAIRSGLRDIRLLNREELLDLYKKNGERGIAKIFGVSKTTIRALREKWDIGKMDKEDRVVSNYPEELSEGQRDVLYGSLLGDGGLTLSDNGKTARYKEFHSLDQLEYLQWKQTVLKPFSGKISCSDKMLEDGRIAYGRTFSTCFHPVFTDFYMSFYGLGTKSLPKDFEERLNPMSMAAWYMDDGHLSDRNKDGVFTLACGFPEEDILRIEDKMNEFGWDAEARKNEDIFIIWINNKDRFFKYIEPHLHPSMRYKIPQSLRGTCVAHRNCKEHIDMFKKQDWDSLTEEQREKEADRFFRYWRNSGFSYPYCDRERREKEMSALRSSDVDISGDNVPVGHTQGTSLCLTFFDNFWSARRKKGKSPVQVFNDDKMLRHVISDCMRYRHSLVDSEMRSELQTFGGVHNFRPAVAKAFINKYCPVGGRVLDPCAGWGGRLLGFLASQASGYVGVEVEKDTVKGLRDLYERMEKDNAFGKEVKIVHSPFEQADIGNGFDLVFTSPPYFDAEIYGQSSGQSMLRYPVYEQWRDGFLYALIEKSFEALKTGGRMILNVANVDGGPVADDARYKIEKTIGIAKVMRLLLASPYGGAQRFEDVIVSEPKSV